MDNDSIDIECPACGKTMKKVYMKEQGIYLDVCSEGCGGIYFDNREFKKFDEPHEDISPLKEVLDGKKFKKVYESEKRFCPVCGMPMVKNYASARHEIEVDDCYGCGGKFLDYKEIDKIRAQYNTEKERADDALKEFFETEAGIEFLKFKNTYYKKNLIVSAVYHLCMAMQKFPNSRYKVYSTDISNNDINIK